MPPPTRRTDEQARRALLRHRQITRNWGLFALVVALIIGSLIAPNTTWLAFLALVVLGSFGLAVGWGLRLINNLFSPPRQ